MFKPISAAVALAISFTVTTPLFAKNAPVALEPSMAQQQAAIWASRPVSYTHLHGGNLGTSGSVAFQFNKLGILEIRTPDGAAEDKLLEVALDAGADDVQNDSGISTVICAPEQFEAVKSAVLGTGLSVENAEVTIRAQNFAVIDEAAAETLRDLLDWLEDLDDVQSVHHNAALPEP